MARRIVRPKPIEEEIQDADEVEVKISSINLNTLINDGMSIIGNELAKYRSKTSRGMTLELKEARAVQGYMDSLVKMMRESREASEHYRKQALENLSDTELVEMAKEYLLADVSKEKNVNLEDSVSSSKASKGSK